jgi:hypothetical protein
MLSEVPLSEEMLADDHDNANPTNAEYSDGYVAQTPVSAGDGCLKLNASLLFACCVSLQLRLSALHPPPRARFLF